MLIGLLSPDSKTNFWKQSPEKKLEGYWGHEEGGGGQECVVPIHVRDPKDDTACPSGRVCLFVFLIGGELNHSFFSFFSLPSIVSH